jgi:hypothetical protein
LGRNLALFIAEFHSDAEGADEGVRMERGEMQWVSISKPKG